VNGDGERGGEGRNEKGREGKGEESGDEVEGGFGRPKNFGVAPSMPDPFLVLRGERRRGEELKGRRGQKGGKGEWRKVGTGPPIG